MKHIDPVKDMRSHKKRPIRKEHPPPRSTFIKDYSDDWMERSRELMREKIFEAIDESVSDRRAVRMVYSRWFTVNAQTTAPSIWRSSKC